MGISDFIFDTLCRRLDVVFSWGFYSPKPLTNGLQFSVQGFNHTGDVAVIKVSQNTYRVRTMSQDGSIKEESQEITIESLIDTVDKMVEYCPNYETKVKEVYGIG